MWQDFGENPHKDLIARCPHYLSHIVQMQCRLSWACESPHSQTLDPGGSNVQQHFKQHFKCTHFVVFYMHSGNTGNIFWGRVFVLFFNQHSLYVNQLTFWHYGYHTWLTVLFVLGWLFIHLFICIYTSLTLHWPKTIYFMLKLRFRIKQHSVKFLLKANWVY